MDVLVIDVGGTHVKLLASGASQPRRFRSGRTMTPSTLVERVRVTTTGWRFDVISLGFPGAVADGRPGGEPGNLGVGWVGYDFQGAFGRPVRLVNDAVMQALGAYQEGRMLFLGLGTGLGSALVTEHVVVPLELGTLPARGGGTMFERVGREALRQHGIERWTRDVHRMVDALREAFAADYVVLGGGNAKRVMPLPERTRRGGNDDAFTGGYRLWEEMVEPHEREPHRVWRVVR
jgi:predicted NBD/HSP70 family sugar kinase